MSPRTSLFCRLEPLLFCHPEAQAERSLGTCVPRDDRVGDVTPSHPFFVAPSHPFFVAPSHPFFVTPSHPFFCRPELPFFVTPSYPFLSPRATPFLSPRATLFLSPRALARGLHSTCQPKRHQSVTPNEGRGLSHNTTLPP